MNQEKYDVLYKSLTLIDNYFNQNKPVPYEEGCKALILVGMISKIKEKYREFEYREMFEPGITGLACIELGYYADPEEKLKYDLCYMENWNMKLDIQICIKTVKLIFQSFHKK